MKKLLSIVLSLVMLLSVFSTINFDVFAQEELTLGSCGDNCTYNFDRSTSTLTISGNGDMTDYVDSSSSPFNNNTDIECVIVNDGVTSIGDYAFFGCTHITSIILSDTVKKLGESCARNCSDLTSINLPDDLNEIGTSAFYDCTNLLSIDIPNGVTQISDYTFCECKNLADITLSDNITKIGNFAFDSCALSTISFPSKLESLGNYAFFGCANLQELVLPDSVVKVGSDVFRHCDSLSNVTLSNNLKSVSERMFQWCSNITMINIPDSVLSINTAAFDECTSLDKIYINNPNCEIYDRSYTIPRNVTIYGYVNSTAQAFADKYGNKFRNFCDGVNHTLVEKIVAEPSWYANGIISFDCEQCDYSYQETTRLTGSLNDVIQYAFDAETGVLDITGSGPIPDTVDGEASFSGISSVQTVNIDDGITSIPKTAFSDCEGLKNINVDEHNSYYSSKDGVLFNKNGTTLLRYGCARTADTYSIPEGVTSIEESAFLNASSIRSITISNSVLSIGKSSFKNCYELTTVTIPKNVKSIEEDAFVGCALDDVIICNYNCTLPTYKKSKVFPEYTIVKGCTGSTAEDYAMRHGVTFEAIGHDYVEVERVEPESYLKSGYFKKRCSICDSEYTEPTVQFRSYSDSIRFSKNNYILPVAKSFVYDNRLYTRYDKPVSDYNVFGNKFNYAEVTDKDSVAKCKELVSDGTKPYYMVGVKRGEINWYNMFLLNVVDPDLLIWHEGQNDNYGGNENMAAYYREDGTFFDIPYETKDSGFITSIALNGLTEDKRAFFKTNKYVFYNMAFPFSLAQCYCEANSGHLATITSEQENTVVKDVASGKPVYIGGERDASDNFVWTNGEPFTYSNWSSGEPNSWTDMGGQFYVQMYATGKWDDCDDITSPSSRTPTISGFICEYEPESFSVKIDQNNTHSVNDDKIQILANYPDGTSNDISDIVSYTKSYVNGCCRVEGSVTEPSGNVRKISEDVVIDGEHTFVQRTVANPTCTEQGIVANICSFCKARYDELIPSNGHQFIVGNSAEATCTNNGYVQYLCSDCGERYKETIYSKGHDLSDWEVDRFATEQEAGLKNRTCSNCDYIEKEILPATGHRFEYTDTVQPTCEDEGYDIYTCISCESIEHRNIVNALGHNYTCNVIPATCTDQGYTNYHCVRCAKDYNTLYVDKLGHNFVNYVFNNDTEDLSYGTESAKCTKCSVVDTRKVGSTNIYCESVSANAGEEISIPVKIKNNAGLMGFALEFEYDASVLSPVCVTKGDIITSGLDDNLQGDSAPGKFKVVWYGTENLVDNGILMYLNFTVDDRANKDVDIKISCLQEDTFNEDFEDVELICDTVLISIFKENQGVSYYGKLNSYYSEIFAGDVTYISCNGAETNTVSINAKHNITFDKNAFSFIGFADKNRHLINTEAPNDSTGNIVLITDNDKIFNVSNSKEMFDVSEVQYLVFVAKEYAKSKDYEFGYTITEASNVSDVTTEGCSVRIIPSSKSEIANIYFDSDISGEYNDTITFPIKISNNKGIMGYKLNFEYDPDQLEIVLVQKATSFPGNLNDTIGVDDLGTFSVLWNGTENITVDGDLINLTFRVLTDKDVISPIRINYSQDDTFNDDYDDVIFNCIDGSVHLNEEEIHEFAREVIDPTPNAKGYTKYTCINCGYSYTGNETDYANDMSSLVAALQKVKSFDVDDYEKNSYNELQSVYTRYLDYPNRSIPQSTIDIAVQDILTAISNLVPYLYLTVKSENGTVIVDGYENENKYSLLFGDKVKMTAIANEGYVFDGWYETVTKRIRSTDATLVFTMTSNTDFEARFIKEQTATLTFESDDGWIAQKIDKTIDEWKAVDDLQKLLPTVPYKLGFINGRWNCNPSDVLQKLCNGENVTIRPEYDKTDCFNPDIPIPVGKEPALDLYYRYDGEYNVGSFIMSSGFPEDCRVESVGIAFYYKNADEFNPQNFDLTINNKMLTSKFDASNKIDMYIVDVNRFSSNYNWAVRGYVTYYDDDDILRTVYSNQINIVDKQQI